MIKSILKDTRSLCFTFIMECAEIAIQYGTFHISFIL